ncbi:response regulator [Pleurocapsa sp. PCC 7319]|uniref:response regulator n=1 Tax=Pleurocapsa sp. PCC 7319 TaxID=118161 RepID=UPI000346DC6D|nr:response regulator [Pleurocapsa sp. PCC 7319]
MAQENNQPILIIEDSDEDFAALTRVITKAHIPNPVYRCEDGEEALDFLYREGEYQDQTLSPLPSLIVLDLNLPGTDGREVLAVIKQDLDLQTIPVVIFSTSSNPKDIDACYRQGISGYIVKPMDTNRLNKLVRTFLEYWFKTVELPNSSIISCVANNKLDENS